MSRTSLISKLSFRHRCSRSGPYTGSVPASRCHHRRSIIDFSRYSVVLACSRACWLGMLVRGGKAGGDERLTDLGKKDRHLDMILSVRQKTHIYIYIIYPDVLNLPCSAVLAGLSLQTFRSFHSERTPTRSAAIAFLDPWRLKGSASFELHLAATGALKTSLRNRKWRGRPIKVE